MPDGVRHVEDAIDTLVWEGWPRHQVEAAIDHVGISDPDDLIGLGDLDEVLAHLWEMEESK